MRFKRFVKLTGYTYVSNSLTNFEYVVHAKTGNGSYLNLQTLHGKTRETTLGELIFGGFQTFGTSLRSDNAAVVRELTDVAASVAVCGGGGSDVALFQSPLLQLRLLI